MSRPTRQQRLLDPFQRSRHQALVLRTIPALSQEGCVISDVEETPDGREGVRPSTVVIALGTDTTDLVITNGQRIWQRNIPIGGNHFTKALSKELRLTFSKAEHLKRNATQADDPKAIFQAMRPVFSDLLAEIQRSLPEGMEI